MPCALCYFHFLSFSQVAVWASNTMGTGAYVTHQTDGNVVVYSASGSAMWDTGTHGQSTEVLTMQDDGHLVLYRPDGSASWGHMH